MSNPLDKIKEEPLKVKHLLWAMGIFKVVLGFLTWFVLWYLEKDIKEATSPLQTKSGFNEWQEKKFDPHMEKFNNANVHIGIILDRTNSRFESMEGSDRPPNLGDAPPPN